MKSIFFIVLLALIGLAGTDSSAQGTFQNLNFEQANVPIIPAGQGGNPVPVSDGVPGWAVYLGGIAQNLVWHNNTSIGAAAVAIDGPQWFPSQILQGSYTVSLQPSTAGPPTTSAIGQTGQIPQTAQSLRFYGSGGYTVTFSGQPIPLVALGATSSYTVFGGDISGYANLTGELRFQGAGLLDNIFFSNQSIPEPAALSLFVLGAFLLSHSLRRRSS